MTFSPKNSRMSKFQSSFNDRETIDKTNSLFKSKANIINELKWKSEALNVKESKEGYDHVLTVNNINLIINENNYETVVQKFSPSMIEKQGEDFFAQKMNNLDVKNKTDFSITTNVLDNKMSPLFEDATNIKYEPSIYVSDNQSILVDKENLQRMLPHENISTNKENGVTTFDITNNFDFSPFSEREVFPNQSKYNTIQVTKKDKHSQSHKRIGMGMIANTLKSNKPKGLNPIPSNPKLNTYLSKKELNKEMNKEFYTVSNFKIDNRKKTSRTQIKNNYNKKVSSVKPSNNYQTNLFQLDILSNFATIEKDNLFKMKEGGAQMCNQMNNANTASNFSHGNNQPKYINEIKQGGTVSSRTPDLRKISMSLEKYSHVFGDVVKGNSNFHRSNKKMNTEDSDMSNFRNRGDSRNNYSIHSMNNVHSKPLNTDSNYKKPYANSIMKDIKDVVIN